MLRFGVFVSSFQFPMKRKEPAKRPALVKCFADLLSLGQGGTGLGLSIVKTIAADHRGQVWAEGEPGYGTVFSFSLPTVPVAAELAMGVESPV